MRGRTLFSMTNSNGRLAAPGTPAGIHRFKFRIPKFMSLRARDNGSFEIFDLGWETNLDGTGSSHTFEGILDPKLKQSTYCTYSRLPR